MNKSEVFQNFFNFSVFPESFEDLSEFPQAIKNNAVTKTNKIFFIQSSPFLYNLQNYYFNLLYYVLFLLFIRAFTMLLPTNCIICTSTIITIVACHITSGLDL